MYNVIEIMQELQEKLKLNGVDVHVQFRNMPMRINFMIIRNQRALFSTSSIESLIEEVDSIIEKGHFRKTKTPHKKARTKKCSECESSKDMELEMIGSGLHGFRCIMCGYREVRKQEESKND